MAEGNFDELKGQAKEGVGEATDNDRLEREGQVDQAAGKAKNWFADIVDKVRRAIRGDR